MTIPSTPGALAAGALAAYLMGSIPFGFLIGKARGIDLRTQGSGNIGATNVFRCVGKGWGLLALLLDALKGWIPAFLFPMALAEGAPNWCGLLFGTAAVAGHNWPVWLKFKGGKGVATSAGMLLGVAPGAVGLALGVFVVVVALTRWVSLGSILAALTAAGAGYWLYYPDKKPLVIVLAILAALLIVRHHANIGRLLRGQESKLVWHRQPADDSPTSAKKS